MGETCRSSQRVPGGLIIMVDRSARDSRQETASAVVDKIVPIRPAQATRTATQTLRQPVARIHILGAMRAVDWSGQNLLPRGRKAKALLGYLCLYPPGEAVARSRV